MPLMPSLLSSEGAFPIVSSLVHEDFSGGNPQTLRLLCSDYENNTLNISPSRRESEN